MKIIAYKDLCKQKKTKRVHIYCTPCLFKPLVFVMGAITMLLGINLVVNNFFQNIEASIHQFVTNFVRYII